jgi:hypothetical protein
VKCLLIYPNPESALNEEAGRLLLEKYGDYFKHAKLMTGIHAKDIAHLQNHNHLTEEPPTILSDMTKKVDEKKRNLRRL